MAIKGPRSALSQFLEEENIKVEKKSDQADKNVKNDHIVKNPIQTEKRKSKRIRHTQPYEIVNIKEEMNEDTIFFSNIHTNYKNHKFEDDDQIEKYCAFLYETGFMTQHIFNYLADKVINKFIVYDCSMIQNFEKIKNMKCLKLNYCGQLQESQMEEILKNNPYLETLHITGAFLLEKINLDNQKQLKDLSVQNCSRLQNDFITQLSNYSILDTLNISYCFGINKNAKLKVNVKNLYLNRVRITKRFFKYLNRSLIEELSISFCPYFFRNDTEKLNFRKFTSLKKLHIDGISEIDRIKINTLEELRASYCFSLSLPTENTNLKILDFSHNNLSFADLNEIFLFKDIEFLNISFCMNVSNEFVIDCIEKLKKLKTIVVFGCFNLTEELGALAWKIKDSVRIIGNHAETKFLLDN